MKYLKFAYLNDQQYVERRMLKQDMNVQNFNQRRQQTLTVSWRRSRSEPVCTSPSTFCLCFFSHFPSFSLSLFFPLSLSLLRTHSLTHSLHCSVVIQLSAPFIIPPLSPAQNYYFFDVLLVENKSISLAINLSSRMGSHTWVVGGNHIFPQVAGVRVCVRARVCAHSDTHCRCDAGSIEAPGKSGMQDELRSDAH